jgi:hypothetical protein
MLPDPSSESLHRKSDSVAVTDSIRLRLVDAQARRHFFVEKSFARTIRLHPLAVDHKLRDGTLAGALDDFVDRTGRAFDIDFLKSNVVLGEKALRLAAVGTPCGGINGQIHAY